MTKVTSLLSLAEASHGTMSHRKKVREPGHVPIKGKTRITVSGLMPTRTTLEVEWDQEGLGECKFITLMRKEVSSSCPAN